MPNIKKKLNIKSFHPWAKYEATSEVFDLALIELSEEFQVSKKKSQKIFSVAALKIKYQPNKEHLHSMLFKSLFINSLASKGQLILKCPLGVIVSTKTTTIYFFLDFCPSL